MDNPTIENLQKKRIRYRNIFWIILILIYPIGKFHEFIEQTYSINESLNFLINWCRALAILVMIYSGIMCIIISGKINKIKKQ
ncbi:hypothetical protein A2229_03880 [Candidatus Peregrinibacteria bacterium RIFOXYA2_FULL_33_7]|nr:MAG: hypothetical protein A2229_03880 [Candidatus Peregrinibacteria bacterium RIFOXYA2_FULL_33_7]